MAVVDTILSELQQSIIDIDTPTYPISFDKVDKIDANIIADNSYRVRASIIDAGDESVKVYNDKSGNTCYERVILVRVSVAKPGEYSKYDDKLITDIQTDLLNAEKSIKQLIASQPSITYLHRWQFARVDDAGIIQQARPVKAYSIIVTTIRYYETGGSAITGTDVIGDGFIDTGLTKLKALMDALITSMASKTPKLSYAYDQHSTANLLLNAVSIGFDSIEQNWQGLQSAPWTNYIINYQLRIHTAYTGDLHNERLTAILINGVINKLMANLNLGDNFRVKGIAGAGVNTEFTETETVGGFVNAQVSYEIDYTQD